VVAQGGHGPWHPRGSGLLVAVVALSVFALLGHGVVALHLLNGTVHPTNRLPPVSAGRPTSTATATPSPTVPSASPSSATPTPSRGGTPTGAVPTGNDASLST
jgi:hypothetical protein